MHDDIYIERARCFGEVVDSTEESIRYNLEDNGETTTVGGIWVERPCPFCGSLNDIHFLSILGDTTFKKDDLFDYTGPFVSSDCECKNCRVWFRTKIRIVKTGD